MKTPSAFPDERGTLTRIALLSTLTLFVEMLLIRWVGTEVRVFAYLQNGVLVAAFLGLGLGCRNARRRVAMLPAVMALALTAWLVSDPLGWGIAEAVTRGLTGFADSVVWGTGSGSSPGLMAVAMVTTLALLGSIARIFSPLGQYLGRWIDGHPRAIAAYTANILGSLAGIVLFDVATLARTPPWLWLLAASVGFMALAGLSDEPRWAQMAAVVLVFTTVIVEARVSAPAVWSPYQKLMIRTIQRPGPNGQPEFCAEEILVNGVFHQYMVDLDPERMARLPALYPPEAIRTSHYVVPAELVGRPAKVLVLGAGSGNDVAGALRAGASTVDAVEIDPVIIEWGRKRHPDRPYSSPRVRVVNDDARAFLRSGTGPYDLIWFAFLDSHTTPSAYTNVRLDHFVYTRESLDDVRRLLSPSGAVVLFFWAETPWLADRLVALLRDAFGTMPLSFRVPSASLCLGHGGTMLIGGHAPTLSGIRQRALLDPGLAPLLRENASADLRTLPTTDDWPYLYLERPSIPRYHLLVAFICLTLGLALRRRMFLPGEKSDPAMMFLGAGFMLLEVAGVSRAALLYGTTWTVNAYVVGSILFMILLANLAASRRAINPLGWPFAGLVTSLLLLACVPTSWLASLAPGPRVFVGGAFLALPVFFSGLIFVAVWAGRERRDLALGSNILGSLAGGVASLLSMLIGFRGLTLVTLGVYAAAVVILRADRRATAPGPSPAP